MKKVTEMSMEELIEERNAIPAQLEAEGADLDALEARVKEINAEIEKRNAEIEKRNAIMEGVKNGAAGTVVKDFKEARKGMTNAEVRNSQAYINAYAEYIKSEDDAECRALLTENVATGTVPVPDLVDDVIRHAWENEGIMALVRKSYLKGNLRVGFELSATGAVVHTEGADAPAQETLVLGIVELVPASIKKWITVSDEAMDLKGEAFLNYIYSEVTYQIAKKAADELIAKIEAAGTVSTSTAVGVPAITQNQITQATIATALAQLSDEATNPVVMMNKQTWAAFKAVQYEGNYSVDPFEGLPVKFNNTIKAFSVATTGETYAIVGDLGHGALANFPNGEGINFKFDDLSLAESDLVKIVGREYVALGLVAPGSFVKIQK